MKVDPRCSSFFAESVKIQAVPACLEDAIQEASVKHRIVSVGALGAGADGFRDLVSGDVGWLCAIAHSLADMIALDIVEDGVKALFSKIRKFLEVQITHAIHGKRLMVTPSCGRLIRWREDWSSEPKEITPSGSSREDHGVITRGDGVLEYIP
ncbi:hypothetical protein DY000_02027628 [Brassica cretica]|uniref:Uncharacterized protein n=1 Tax=Brassica cretica TaxID=69181 RepID=A0ABQ7E5J0_BRACR|nr:hypothetical protein DY000_02027628 [Brassica cretica]